MLGTGGILDLVKKNRTLPKSTSRGPDRHLLCAQCGQRYKRCRCASMPPPIGVLQWYRYGKFLEFITGPANTTRFLSWCHAVRIMVTWIQEWKECGGSTKLAFVGVFAFRIFNRMPTWWAIAQAWDAEANCIKWGVLAEALSNEGAKFKAFARPKLMKSQQGVVVGADSDANFIAALKKLCKLPATDACAALLDRGIREPADWTAWVRECDSISAALGGVAGQYHLKLCDDVWVESGAISRNALSFYRVCKGAGTYLSLQYLYGQRNGSSVPTRVAQDLLQHLFHQYKQNGAFVHKKESIATLSLGLCCWHRHRSFCSYGGKRMTVLERAGDCEEDELRQLAARIHQGETLDSEQFRH